MFNWVLNTPLFFEMYIHNIEIGTSCLDSFSKALFKKKFQNSWSIQKRIFTAENDLSKATPATLLQSLSVIGSFLEILQGFKENSFQYKKHL